MFIYIWCVGLFSMYYLDNHFQQLSWVIMEEHLPFLLDVMLFFYLKKFLYLICMLESDERISIKSAKQN